MPKNKSTRRKQNQNQEDSPKLAFSTRNAMSKVVVFLIIAALILSVAATFFSTPSVIPV
jgi:quinol-cytochrome oxidoreductase complex cytochrome b subunit